MKYLTNKKLWAAIIGLITALGTLMVTLDEAKADVGTPGFVPYAMYRDRIQYISNNTAYYILFDVHYGLDGLTPAVRFSLNNTGPSMNKEARVFIMKRDQPPLVYANSSAPSVSNTKELWRSTASTIIYTGNLSTNTAIHKLDKDSSYDDIHSLLKGGDCFVFVKIDAADGVENYTGDGSGFMVVGSVQVPASTLLR